jgi:hypothetical protein
LSGKQQESVADIICLIKPAAKHPIIKYGMTNGFEDATGRTRRPDAFIAQRRSNAAEMAQAVKIEVLANQTRGKDRITETRKGENTELFSALVVTAPPFSCHSGRSEESLFFKL